MTNFPILDLILGLIFIYFILSIITSSLVEIIMSRKNYRGKTLGLWLETTFGKKIADSNGKLVTLGTALANHGITTALSKTGEATSFMDAKNFVSALLEKISFDPENPEAILFDDLPKLMTALNQAKAVDGSSLLSTELLRTFQIFASEAIMASKASTTQGTPPAGTAPVPANNNAFQLFRTQLEQWFDSNMERVTGKMKRQYTRPLTFWLGLAVVIGLNADTVKITKYLFDHQEEAKAFANKAIPIAQKLDTLQKTQPAEIKMIAADIDTLKNSAPTGMPLGWDGKPIPGGIIGAVEDHAVGWAATLLAIMLGAPFWFDLLNKIGNIRGAGGKPLPSKDAAKAGS